MEFTSNIIVNERSLIPKYKALLTGQMKDGNEVQLIFDKSFHYGRLQTLIDAISESKPDFFGPITRGGSFNLSCTGTTLVIIDKKQGHTIIPFGNCKESLIKALTDIRDATIVDTCYHYCLE